MNLEKFLDAYVDCALWSSIDMDEHGTPLDENYSVDDIAPETLQAMRDDCTDFIEANAADLSDMDAASAGHDFWLTRNHHGAGFWDRGLGDLGKRLTHASHAYGGVDLYVGDNGMIYA